MRFPFQSNNNTKLNVKILVTCSTSTLIFSSAIVCRQNKIIGSNMRNERKIFISDGNFGWIFYISRNENHILTRKGPSHLINTRHVISFITAEWQKSRSMKGQPGSQAARQLGSWAGHPTGASQPVNSNCSPIRTGITWISRIRGSFFGRRIDRRWNKRGNTCFRWTIYDRL